MSRAAPRRLSALLAGAVLAVALAGCASGGGGGLSAARSSYGSPSAEMAVQRFLEAVGREDFQGMGQQFGTRQGPAEERLGISQVEQRMMVLEGHLQHDSFEVQEADLARTGPHRTRFLATLTGTRYGRVQVPMVAVVTPDDRWFVEQVDTESLGRQQ